MSKTSKIIIIILVGVAVVYGIFHFIASNAKEKRFDGASTLPVPQQLADPDKNPGQEQETNNKKCQPALNCAASANVSEQLICSDQELMQMECRYEELIQLAEQSHSKDNEFSDQTQDALKQREQCGDDKSCLTEWFGKRNEELEKKITDRAEIVEPDD